MTNASDAHGTVVLSVQPAGVCGPRTRVVASGRLSAAIPGISSRWIPEGADGRF